MIDVYSFEVGVTYTVAKDFIDFYGNKFSRGERLTYNERHFLPYDGGHTIVFKERNLYLQEQENKNVLDSLSDYFYS